MSKNRTKSRPEPILNSSLPPQFRQFRLALAREPGHPEGDDEIAYIIVAPLDPEDQADRGEREHRIEGERRDEALAFLGVDVLRRGLGERREERPQLASGQHQHAPRIGGHLVEDDAQQHAVGGEIAVVHQRPPLRDLLIDLGVARLDAPTLLRRQPREPPPPPRRIRRGPPRRGSLSRRTPRAPRRRTTVRRRRTARRSRARRTTTDAAPRTAPGSEPPPRARPSSRGHARHSSEYGSTSPTRDPRRGRRWTWR